MGYYSSVTSGIFFANAEERDAFIEAHQDDLDKVERGGCPVKTTTTPPGLVLEKSWTKWYGNDMASILPHIGDTPAVIWETMFGQAEEMAEKGADVSGFFIRIGEDWENGDIEDTRFYPNSQETLRAPDPYELVSVNVAVELDYNIQ